jgi:hypothetical protein
VRKWIALLAVVGGLALLGACGGDDESPSGTIPAGQGVVGTVTAGPACPVARPDDPSCTDQPVDGAVIVATGANGDEVARATTKADGTYTLPLPAGHYTLVPQPVTGILGTASAVTVDVPEAKGPPEPVRVDIVYDTGIRN